MMATVVPSGPRIFERAKRPFPYILADGVVEAELADSLLDWFEGAAPWRLVEADFYEQFEFSLLHDPLPPAVRPLVSEEALAVMREMMERAFGQRLTDRVALVAHKLIPGQRIAIHNDYLIGGETHRLTVQLNRGLSDTDGGFFMLFSSFDAADVHRILRPISGSAIGFEIGPFSNHAVSRVHGGERYTLVYSFHADSPDPQ
jgi:hypothetical protein